MTAIYGSSLGNTVQLLTDGAVVDFDGVLVSTKTKVHTSKLIPLAVTGRGQTEFLDKIGPVVVGYSNVYGFDATLVWLQETLLGMRETFEAKGRLGEFDIVVAGLSETHGLGLWLISTHIHYKDFPGYDLGPFVMAKMPDVAFGPMPPADALATARADEVAPEELFRRHGGSLLTAARGDLTSDWHTDELRVPIGGHIDLTVLTKDSVSVERLLTWPDVVGEKLKAVV